MAKKKFRELNLNDSFLFAAVSQDEKICSLIVELILGIPVRQISVNAEDAVLYSSDYRGIRLDAHAHVILESGHSVNINLEMQNKDEKNISHRSRYHQGILDVSSLKPGESFIDMKDCFIIFICNFDPGGLDFCRYTAKMTYEGSGESIGDGATRIFLYANGKKADDISVELKYFLRYINNSTEEYAVSTGNKKIMELHKKVEELKKDRRLEAKFMKVQDLLDMEYIKGEKNGFIKGERNGFIKGEKNGFVKGEKSGLMQGNRIAAKNMFQRGYSAEETAALLEVAESMVRQWFEEWS